MTTLTPAGLPEASAGVDAAPAIRTIGLTKNYGGRVGVDSLTG